MIKVANSSIVYAHYLKTNTVTQSRRRIFNGRLDHSRCVTSRNDHSCSLLVDVTLGLILGVSSYFLRRRLPRGVVVTTP